LKSVAVDRQQDSARIEHLENRLETRREQIRELRADMVRLEIENDELRKLASPAPETQGPADRPSTSVSRARSAGKDDVARHDYQPFASPYQTTHHVRTDAEPPRGVSYGGGNIAMYKLWQAEEQRKALHPDITVLPQKFEASMSNGNANRASSAPAWTDPPTKSFSEGVAQRTSTGKTEGPGRAMPDGMASKMPRYPDLRQFQARYPAAGVGSGMARMAESEFKHSNVARNASPTKKSRSG